MALDVERDLHWEQLGEPATSRPTSSNEAPNYNEVRFPGVRADRMRPQAGFGMGLKEVQVFRTRD
jgi:hypothetical protein